MDQQALNDYVAGLFAPEDDALQHIQEETRRNDMPAISLSPQEGRLLQFLAKSVGARKAVEIGTLAGYSGTWLARALPEDGRLFTLEYSDKHAAVARANFEKAGVAHKVEIVQGPATDSFAKIAHEAPFDFIFIDADKPSYKQYLSWAVEHVRPGGMITAHNAFRGGGVLNATDDGDREMHEFNRMMADDPRLFSIILAIGDGMAAGIRQA